FSASISGATPTNPGFAAFAGWSREHLQAGNGAASQLVQLGNHLGQNSWRTRSKPLPTGGQCRIIHVVRGCCTGALARVQHPTKTSRKGGSCREGDLEQAAGD